MAKSFEIGLNSKINTFSKRFGIQPSISEKELFEAFSNYVIVSNLIQDDFKDINKLSTGQAKGLDGIAIIVNNQVINDESDLDKIGENENIKITICFIQATTLSSFDMKKFQAFNDEVINFLTLQYHIEPFSDILQKLFEEEGRFIDQISETPIIEVFFSSGKTKHVIDDKDLESELKKYQQRNDFLFQFNISEIKFIQSEELISLFNKIDGFLEVLVKFNQDLQLQEKENISMSLLSSISFDELKKIIISSDNVLREKIFVENVRSKIKESDVNKDILDTLSDSAYRKYFVYLNNGITILCESIKRHEVKSNNYYLKYPRIINGCQTSHMLYEYYIKKPDNLKEIEIIAKVISTQDKELKKKIIYATNNQNPIDKDLESLNNFHRDLEEYFIGNKMFDIYYERLRGQYSDITPPYKVIDKENIAKIYISIFLMQPYEMKSNSISKIERFKDNKQIFNLSTDEELIKYYLCGVFYYFLNYFVANNKIELKSKTMDMHLLMICLKLLEKKKMKIQDILVFLQEEENALKIFTNSITTINTFTPLFERRGFYSSPKTKKLLKEVEDVIN